MNSAQAFRGVKQACIVSKAGVPVIVVDRKVRGLKLCNLIVRQESEEACERYGSAWEPGNSLHHVSVPAVQCLGGKVVIQCCSISSTSGACVEVRNGANPVIRSNYLHNSPKGQGVLFMDAGSGAVCEYNEVAKCSVGVEVHIVIRLVNLDFPL
jgi:hypothetical protein